MKWVPVPYMKKAVRFVVERAYAGLWLDPGLRKTSIVLAVLKILKAKKLMRGALVLAPLRVAYSVWPGEIAKWDDFKGLRHVILHGPDKDQLFKQKADIYIVNYDGIPWLFEKLSKISPEKWPFDVLIADESSKLKYTNTKRFKTLKPWLKFFQRRIGMTGSPAPNSLIDVFGQAYVLDQGAALGRFITHYQRLFFEAHPFNPYLLNLKDGADKEIYKRLGPLVLRLMAEDHIDLPELTFNDIYVDLPPKALARYRTMEKQFFAEAADGTFTVASNAGVASGKCFQMANGAFYKVPGEPEWEHVHDAKITALEDHLEDLNGHPTLVSYYFQHDRERIAKLRKTPFAHIGRGTKPGESLALEAAWNRDELDVLLVHPDSVAHGLNLQAGVGHLCLFSMMWDFEKYDQLIRRLLRSGRLTKVIVTRILARGTIDEVIATALAQKGDRQHRLSKALQEYATIYLQH